MYNISEAEGFLQGQSGSEFRPDFSSMANVRDLFRLRPLSSASRRNPSEETHSLDDLYEKGLAVRRSVLGDAHVDRSLKARDELTQDMQQCITEFGWGTIWARPGLSLRDRSLITVAFLTALGRSHELVHHLIGALRNGVTPKELTEVFLHSGLYCGFPAAQEGVRAAREAIKQYEAEAKAG
jgi:4-carboxymuconolactone decarboxylase